MSETESVIYRSEGKIFGTDSDNVNLYYPVVINDRNYYTLAIFTAHELEVAIKRAESNLKDVLF